MKIDTQLQLSVLTAPIAATDRRALSQAWYSALYHGARPQMPPRAVPRQSGGQLSQPHNREVVKLDAKRPSCSNLMPYKRAAAMREMLATERRSVRSPLSRKIERAFAHRLAAPNRQTFELGSERGRVCVMLQSDGKRIVLIAICAKRAEAAVAQALAQARYALARSALTVVSQTKRFTPC